MKNTILLLALFMFGIAAAQKSPSTTPAHRTKTIKDLKQPDTAKVKPLLKQPDQLKEAPGKNDPNEKGSGMTVSPADSPKLDTSLNPVTPVPTPNSPTTPVMPREKMISPAK